MAYHQFAALWELTLDLMLDSIASLDVKDIDEWLLLTPWSVRRNWVWMEVGAAWGLGKRTVGVLYGLTIQDVEREYGGMAALAPTNCLGLDEFDTYISELKARI